MSLGPYPESVRAIADELAELLREEPLRSAAFRVLAGIGEEGLLGMKDADADKALKLLSQTPSQRSKALARLDAPAAATLVLQARYLGLLSYAAFRIADRLFDIRGSSYRGAAERGARLALSAREAPSLADVLPGWQDPGRGGEDDRPRHVRR